MIIDQRAADFTEALAALRFENVFNPYSEICPVYDRPEGPALRRRNLELVLTRALEYGVDTVWVARDLGYRGGRRTGLAMTDEVNLRSLERLMGTPKLVRATKGPPISERTAGVVWKVIDAIDRPVFLWNVFPLHPHQPNEPLSNRLHTRPERKGCEPLLRRLLDLLSPERVFAVGRDAHRALETLGTRAAYVRHPSYGGQAEFESTMAREYSLSQLVREEQGVAI